MATLTLRVDGDTRDELERFARARNVTVSDLLRSAIDDLLGRGGASPVRTGVPRSIDIVNRRVLTMLHEILERVGPDGNATDHRRQIEALAKGFTAEYENEFAGLDPELPPSESQLVHDILEMFTVLEAGVGQLEEQARAELGEGARNMLEFGGFDLNDSREARLLSYARHLIKTERWESLAHHFDRKHQRGNSHMPILDKYQRMLLEYKRIMKRKLAGGRLGVDAYRFDLDDLRSMVNAASWS